MPDFANAQIQWSNGSRAQRLLDLARSMSDDCDNTDSDDTLALYLQIAGEAAEHYVDNVLVSQTVTQNLSKPRTPVQLHYFPYVSDLVVTVDGVTVTDDYEVMKDPGVSWCLSSRSLASRSRTFEQMVISYTAGYSPLPAEVGHAIAMAALAYKDSAGTVAGAVKKESIVGVGSIEYVASNEMVGGVGILPPATVAVLDRYRRFSA